MTYLDQTNNILDCSKNVDALKNMLPFISYGDEKRPLLIDIFIEIHYLFVIDCSKADGIKSATANIKLDIEARTKLPDNSKPFHFINHNCLGEFLRLHEHIPNLV